MFGVYIHFPYCRKLCPYCDFAVVVRKEIPHEVYAAAVIAELNAKASWFSGRALRTIYFGGGTPSLWEPACVAKVIGAVTNHFGAATEVTLEANPDDLPFERLAGYRAAGVNRLSIGAQSFGGEQLAFLGRTHDASATRGAVAAARRAGFENFSLDLIIAQPGQSLPRLAADIAEVVALAPTHVSAYMLTIEERTPFFKLAQLGRLQPLSNEAQAEYYEHAVRALERAGYAQYEISSYAKPGWQSMHNSIYWQSGEYLGLGCSAHALRFTENAAERFANPRELADYLAVSEQPRAPSEMVGYEKIPLANAARDAVWLGLRQLEGLSRKNFAARFGFDPVVQFRAELDALAHKKLLTWDDEKIRLTPTGVLFADDVALAMS